MSPSLKHLSGETQRIADTVLMEQALSAPRLRTENEKLRALLEKAPGYFPAGAMGCLNPACVEHAYHNAYLAEIRAILAEI